MLEEALDNRQPLLERVKFLAIVGTNLNEFFMIRVAGIKQHVKAGAGSRRRSGRQANTSDGVIAYLIRYSADV